VKLIVGLGNPGILYTNSRHNIGFSAVKLLAKQALAALKKDKQTFSLSAKFKIDNDHGILALPLTFMNLSGVAVSALVKKYKIDSSDLLIVCDDLDLEFGRIRLRPWGSSAGHRGVRSIIDILGTDEFGRLRVGIGRPGDNKEASGYVLSQFNRKEKNKLGDILMAACDCCRMWVSEGMDKTMNTFNRSLPAGRQGAAKESRDE